MFGKRIPNQAVKNLLQKGPLIRSAEKQGHKISCPYCQIGFAPIMVEIIKIGERKEVKVDGMEDPHKCVICEKEFRLTLKIVGIPIK